MAQFYMYYENRTRCTQKKCKKIKSAKRKFKNSLDAIDCSLLTG